MPQRLTLYTQRLLDAAQGAMHDYYHREVEVVQRIIDTVTALDPGAAKKMDR